MRQVIQLQNLDFADLPEVGGEVASLGELLRALAPKGVRIPDGFAVSAEGFRLHLRRAGLLDRMYSDLDALNVADRATLAQVAGDIRDRIRSAPLPPELDARIAEAYRQLGKHCEEEDPDVAVRASVTDDEPLSGARARRPKTHLNVRGRAALMRAVRDCMAESFSDGAIVSRVERGVPHRDVACGVAVQKMVRSDLACAGTLLTLDPESGFQNVVIVRASWGLGESVVRDRVTADAFWVHKPGLDQGFEAIIRRDLGAKPVRVVYAARDGGGAEEQEVPEEQRHRFVLSDDEVLLLARWGVRVEQHFSNRTGTPTPISLDWAKDGRNGQLYVVSARAARLPSEPSRPLEPEAEPRLPVLLDIANLNGAFALGRLPSAGVGALRTEPLLAETLGIHPSSLFGSERVTEEDASRLFVDALASGIARIGAAFYPRPVVAVLSDFGSSLGFSRSCQALRRVRDGMGLRNVKAMIPLGADAASTRKALAELENNGLFRGDHEFEVYLACKPGDETAVRGLSDVVDGFWISAADASNCAAARRFIASAHEQRRKSGLLLGAPHEGGELSAWLDGTRPDWVCVTPTALPLALSVLSAEASEAH